MRKSAPFSSDIARTYKILSFSLIVLCLSSCERLEEQDKQSLTSVDNLQVSLEQARQSVIYGEDTRQDVYELNDFELEQKARRSILAMFDSQSLQISSDGSVSIRGGTLSQRYRLCTDQRYRNQIAASSCSATLIDNDIIVTAGHCIESQAECETKSFVFGYLMDNADRLAAINREQVFSCQQLLSQINTPALDYAFVKLDRAVDPAIGEPSPVIQSTEPLSQGEPLVMMGFPSGLPLKVDNGGFVSDPRGATPPLNYFKGTVDAFGGNSGSGVFNAAGEQVGILVRGETDYVQSGRCNVVNELSEDRGPGDDAEEITYLSRALSALCDSGYPSEVLCGQSLRGLCFECEVDGDCLEGYRCGRFSQYPEAPSFCAPPCEDGGVCPDGHQCILGQCTPSESRSCDENTVVAQDSCGRTLANVEICSEGLYCRRGACLSASEGDRCESATLLDTVSQQIQGTFQEGYTGTSQGSCGGGGPDAFYRLVLDQPNHLVATATGLDTVLYVRTGCEMGSELACVDDSRPPGRYGSQISLDLDIGEYVIGLDSYNPQERGDFTLDIELCDRICELGELRCDGQTGLSRCELNTEGCVAWSPAISCENGGVCQDGVCQIPSEGDRCSSAEELDLNTPDGSVRRVGVIDRQYTLGVGSRCSDIEIRDRFYQFQLDRDSLLSASIVGTGVVAISLYQDCPNGPNSGLELSCSPILMGNASLDEQLAPGRYTLVVSSDATGEYELEVSTTHNCIDECDPTLPRYCDAQDGLNGEVEETVMACLLGPSGCTQLTVDEVCSGRLCAGGACQDECFNTCNLGERECSDQETVIACIADERGCAFWAIEQMCETGLSCGAEGRCLDPESDWGMGIPEEGGEPSIPELTLREQWEDYPGPKEVLIPQRTRGGCNQAPIPNSPLIVFIFISFALVRPSRLMRVLKNRR